MWEWWKKTWTGNTHGLAANADKWQGTEWETHNHLAFSLRLAGGELLRCYRHHRCRLSCHPHRRPALWRTEQESDAGSIYASATFERGISQVEQDANERAILYRGCFEEDRVGRSGYVRVVLFFFGTRKLERRTREHMIHFLKNVMENRTGHASREAYHRRDVEIEQEQAWPHSASELGWLRWVG